MRLTESCERLRPGVAVKIVESGREYWHQMWYEDNFDLNDQEMRLRRKDGLPAVQRNGHPYINLQDFFDFHSGRIGKPRKWFAWMADVSKICAGVPEDG